MIMRLWLRWESRKGTQLFSKTRAAVLSAEEVSVASVIVPSINHLSAEFMDSDTNIISVA